MREEKINKLMFTTHTTHDFQTNMNDKMEKTQKMLNRKNIE